MVSKETPDAKMFEAPDAIEKVKFCELSTILEEMEDQDLDSHSRRSKNYTTIINAFHDRSELDNETTERLLKVCQKDLTSNLQYSLSALMVISNILKKIKKQQCKYQKDKLTQSAVTVVNIMKKLLSKPLLRKQGFETLLLYPDETLKILAMNHWDEMRELIEYPFKYGAQPEITSLISQLVVTLLKIDELFIVTRGLDTWFSIFIPALMVPGSWELAEYADKNIEALELLTEHLQQIDYAEHPMWLNFLKCICDGKKYPQILVNICQKGNNYWHRLWMVFIKLVKRQITVNLFGVSPINALLPVVETALKKEDQRCKAYACWKVLIDNFVTEINEPTIDKRLRLLLIPLKLNNAKTPEIINAKYDCWWHLMSKFCRKLDQFTDTVLVQFLNFCFGKPDVDTCPPKKTCPPGQMTDVLQWKCVEGLVEMIGHVDCDGCCSLPRLENKLITTKLLADHWNLLMHILKKALQTAAKQYNESTMKQTTCLWRGFVGTIAELPENQIRADMFVELLKCVESLLEICKTEDNMADVIIDILIGTLVSDPRVKPLLKSKSEMGPLHIILRIIQCSVLRDFYDRSIKSNPNDPCIKLKPITKLMLDASLTNPNQIIEWLLRTGLRSYCKLILWTALADSICESGCDLKANILCSVALWPLKNVNEPLTMNSGIVCYKWYTLYSCTVTRAGSGFDESIKQILLANETNSPLALAAAVALLKQKAMIKEADCTTEAQLSLDAMKKHLTEDMDKYFPNLIDTVVLLFNKIIEHTNLPLGRIAVQIVSIVVQKIVELKELKLIFMQNLQEPLGQFCEIDVYTSLKTDAMKILNMVKPSKTDSENPLVNTADANVPEGSEEINKKSFTKPEQKVPKKVKNKEPNIVNTVVENGEEYVVVKSNWKFNPKKLTENQKEKLKRKREDIPALYQDLSQSQDEFKLKTWKPDSQETSTTSSKSESNSKSANEDVSVMLQKLPSVEVVPKIIQSFSTENVDKPTSKSNEDSANNNNKLKKTPTIKGPKTPRMALKDKVLRNVRNLMEKSGGQGDDIVMTRPLADMNQTVNENLTTPKTQAIPVVAVTSAPPNLSSERPSRSLKKPKKFADAEIFGLKKRRRSQSSDSQKIEPCSLSDESVKISDEGIISNETDINKQPDLINKGQEHSHIKELQPNASDANSIGKEVSSEKPSRSLKKPKKFQDAEIFGLKKRRRSQCSDPQQNTLSSLSDKSVKTPDDGIISNETNTNKQPDLVTKGQQHTHIQELPPDAIDANTISKEVSSEKTDAQEKSHDEQIALLPSNLSHDTDKAPSPEIAQKVQGDDKMDVDDCYSQDNNSQKDQVNEAVSTQQPKKMKKEDAKASPIVKKLNRLLGKQLSIDTVEGRPELPELPELEGKRITRKSKEAIDTSLIKTRRNKIEMCNKPIPETTVSIKVPAKEKQKSSSKSPSPKSVSPQSSSPNTKKLHPRPQESEQQSQTINILDSEDQSIESQQDMPLSQQDIPESEDVIESSQDSTLTTISIKPTNKEKIPIVRLSKYNPIAGDGSQNILEGSNEKSLLEVLSLGSSMSEELPKNKTAEISDLTENMDTEPLDSSGEVIIINDETPTPIVINTEETVVSKETQEMAEADTLPMDVYSQSIPATVDQDKNVTATVDRDKNVTGEIKSNEKDITHMSTQKNLTPSITRSAEVLTDIIAESSNSGSPLKDDVQRKKDFLNNTIEISPIKTLSPVQENRSPSPETSNDFEVIKLTSPVLSNGEPYNENCESPEVFTEDKVSPDKREQSPPRKEVTITNNSPSSSLSLKNNRPQMRFNGRAAQMLGLCVPEKLQILNTDRESEETKKSNCQTMSTPARRNLKIFYGSSSENTENPPETESEDSENFLKFTRALPTAETSPAIPILKRKLADIDESTVSPASKRKRVSFHDPPVSGAVAVQKYIEPCGSRSPSNSAFKKQERHLRSLSNAKSPKRLDNVFRLDKELTKTVERFSDDSTISNDTELSLDETPAAEVVKTSELNDTDPICPELLDCKDPVDNIAADLSSPSTKALLIKELEGKVETVADLAKMTELEVNRLCIKAPKVQVAKKVLSKYATEKAKLLANAPVTIITVPVVEPVVTPEIERVNMDVQTDDVMTEDCGMQTECVPATHSSVQTNESGCSTEDIVSTCLKERPDFIEQLGLQLGTSAIQHIADKLPFDACLSLLHKKTTTSNCSEVINKALETYSKLSSKESQLKILLDHIYKTFDLNDIHQ